MANCPQCNTAYDAGTIFCDNCGASLAAAAPAPPVYQPPMPQQPAPLPTVALQSAGGTVCAQCSAPLAPGSAFCDNCGAPAGPAQPTYPQPQPTYQPPPQPAYQQPQPTYQPPQPTYSQPQPTYQPPQPAYPQPQPTYQPQQPAYQQPQPTYQPPQPAYPQQPPAGGPAPRLVVQTTNASIVLPPGKAEYIVGREDPVSNVFPDVDMTPHGGDDGGVSRRHARLFQQGGQWFVEDYQSTNFTHVNNVRVQPGVPTPVPNGAEVRFGRIKLMFYTQ